MLGPAKHNEVCQGHRSVEKGFLLGTIKCSQITWRHIEKLCFAYLHWAFCAVGLSELVPTLLYTEWKDADAFFLFESRGSVKSEEPEDVDNNDHSGHVFPSSTLMPVSGSKRLTSMFWHLGVLDMKTNDCLSHSYPSGVKASVGMHTKWIGVGDKKSKLLRHFPSLVSYFCEIPETKYISAVLFSIFVFRSWMRYLFIVEDIWRTHTHTDFCNDWWVAEVLVRSGNDYGDRKDFMREPGLRAWELQVVIWMNELGQNRNMNRILVVLESEIEHRTNLWVTKFVLLSPTKWTGNKGRGDFAIF